MKIGLIINPLAGIGGTVALKGSDGSEIQEQAFRLGAKKQAAAKTSIVLEDLLNAHDSIFFYSIGGEMGEDVLIQHGLKHEIVYRYKDIHSSSSDTIAGAKRLIEKGIDLLIFAGGDGTARDIYKAIGQAVPVLGIPCGVKIHSAVFANSLAAVSKILQSIVSSGAFETEAREVMDINEESYRQGFLEAKKFGTLIVPRVRQFLQHPKATSSYYESDIQGLAWELEERIEARDKNTRYIWGTGGTIFQIMQMLNYDSTLLGVDVTESGRTLIKDATEEEILEKIVETQSVLILSVIGGQGHILGRGNLQISPKVVRCVGADNIWIVATMGKILDLEKHLLHVDSADKDVNKMISGFRRVIVGWQKELLCEVVT